jgi:lysophospholipase L1-like esterase
VTKVRVLLFGLVVCGSPCAAADLPLVPTKLCHVRDGLGNVFQKLKGDGAVRIAYFGGSITAAAGWRVKTLDWFRKTWPAAKVEEINAAIGGTGSDLGVFRCGRDVLAAKPDLVFVEFAVNDGGADPVQIHRTIEGIVRQTWQANAETDLCFVYTLHENMRKDYAEGLCPRSASAHERIAEHYGIPSISVALRISELERDGKLVFNVPKDQKPPEGKTLFSGDSCHPTDAGHAIFCEVIATALKEIEAKSKPGPHALKPPYDADNWEDAHLVDIEPAMLTGSWKKLDPAQGLGRAFANRLPTLWHSGTPGDKLAFRFKGTLCRLYDLVGPDGGIALVQFDGKQAGERPRFDSYCTGHRLAAFTVGDTLENKEHRVVIEVSRDQPDREPVLARVRNEKGFDPKKYDGTNLWLGYLMLRGELVKE